MKFETQKHKMQTLLCTQTLCLLGEGCSGSCAGLDGTSGFTESWLGHNCHSNGHCL